MNRLKTILCFAALILAIAMVSPASLRAKSLKGAAAPLFALKDTRGTVHDLAKMQGASILVLYFFDAASRASQEGLFSLNEWVKEYKTADLQAWAVTRSDESGVNKLLQQSQADIPVLLDNANVSDLYNARMVLPTVCIIGPQRKVIHFIQGGGKSTEIMLTKVAEVQLQRSRVDLAAKMGEELAAKDPQNIEARAIAGHARLRAGQVAAAKSDFTAIPADSTEGKRLRQEGLSEVYIAQGDFDKAWETAQKLEQSAPQSAGANLSKAKVLIHKGDTAAAEKELARGAAKTTAFAFQRSEAVNKRGRLASGRGSDREAIDLYGQAEEIDPYNIEATSNKGLLLEKEGRLDQALKAYRQVLDVNKDDIYAAAFAKRIEAKLAVENDLEKKKRMDALIKDLSARFQTQRKKAEKEEKDDWTSRPMILSFINIKESGGLPDRDGFVLVLADQLTEFLNASGRVKVVDRRMLEAVVDELNLGASELSDPQTALKLGKLFAAKIIVTGTVHYLPGETLLSLRLLDTETSMVAKVITRQLSGSLDKELGRLNTEILTTITRKYPLKGYVADVNPEQVVINIGQNQGVVLGTQFAAIKEGASMTYKGKVLSGAPQKIALLKVVQVEPEFSMARIVSSEAALKQDDKITEMMTER